MIHCCMKQLLHRWQGYCIKGSAGDIRPLKGYLYGKALFLARGVEFFKVLWEIRSYN